MTYYVTILLTCPELAQYNTLFTHATSIYSRGDENSLKGKKIKLPFLNLSKNLLLYYPWHFIGNKFQSFAAKNEDDLWPHS